MNFESVNSNKPNPSAVEEDNPRSLDREIRTMASALTHRLTNIHHKNKSGSNQQSEDEEDHGVRIITLAGSNEGATMRAALDETPDAQGMSPQDHEAMATYVNSNVQAINNSIMLGGSYECKDPGVHVETTAGYMEHHGHEKEKYGKKGKKKVKGSHHSDQHSDMTRNDSGHGEE